MCERRPPRYACAVGCRRARFPAPRHDRVRCRPPRRTAARTQPFECWCAAMPGLPDGAQPARGARCMCPECLADEIARQVAGKRA
ncbi:hypothetical protein WJ63_03240 [Burkholderia pyrrocinia]|nr:hypothetical protein WJ63_03240 [Burkholderia pyrrocinia]